MSNCKIVQYSDLTVCHKCHNRWDTNDRSPPICGDEMQKIIFMQQTKKHSFIEVCLSTAIGYLVAVLTQYFIFPYFDIYTSFQSNLQIGLIFTAISIIRSYVIRRLFNRLGGR